MGLESVNFLFKSEYNLKDILLSFDHIYSFNNREYFYKEDKKFWIDLLLQDQFRLSIRIALCNPMEEVLNAFFLLLDQLFEDGGLLFNLNDKREFADIADISRSEIREIYKERKDIFEKYYGYMEMAIGVESFYEKMKST